MWGGLSTHLEIVLDSLSLQQGNKLKKKAPCSTYRRHYIHSSVVWSLQVRQEPQTMHSFCRQHCKTERCEHAHNLQTGLQNYTPWARANPHAGVQKVDQHTHTHSPSVPSLPMKRCFRSMPVLSLRRVRSMSMTCMCAHVHVCVGLRVCIHVHTYVLHQWQQHKTHYEMSSIWLRKKERDAQQLSILGGLHFHSAEQEEAHSMYG